MALTVDYLPFATGLGAAVMSQADYIAAAPNGVVAGLADETGANKSWRQASMVSAALANVVSQRIQANLLDDGNLTALVSQILQVLYKTQLMANTAFFINATTGSDANNGLTSGTAWQTPTGAYNNLRNGYDTGGFKITVNCVGPFTVGLFAAGQISGQTSETDVEFLGNIGSPVALNPATGPAVFAENGAKVSIQGFHITASGTGGVGLEATGPGAIVSFGNCTFDTCAVAHIVSDSSAQVLMTDNYSIVGNSLIHWVAQVGGNIATTNVINITLTGTPAFSQSFAKVQACGNIFLEYTTPPTFVGSATGSRYLAKSNGTISTAGSGATYLPGNAGGTFNTGGQYL